MQATIENFPLPTASGGGMPDGSETGDGEAPLCPRAPQMRALLDYWNRKRAGRPFILWSDLRPSEILPLLPVIFVLDIENRPRRYRIRLMGSGIVKRFGGEFTGRYMDELDFGSATAQVLADYDQVADRVTPHHAFSEYTRQGGGRMEAERLALPMSTDGRAVDRILGAVLHTPCGVRQHRILGLANKD